MGSMTPSGGFSFGMDVSAGDLVDGDFLCGTARAERSGVKRVKTRGVLGWVRHVVFRIRMGDVVFSKFTSGGSIAF